MSISKEVVDGFQSWANENIQEKYRKQFVAIATREYDRSYGKVSDLDLKVALLQGGFSKDAVGNYIEARHKNILRAMRQVSSHSFSL